MSPCHFVFIRSLALGSMKQYETPLGMLNIDLETIAEIKNELKVLQ